FVVDSMRCGQQHVGGQGLLGRDAQGQFCIVSLSVSNIGRQARDFAAGNQKLAFNGRLYSAEIWGTVVGGSPALLSSLVNPGNRIAGSLVFDVPEDVRPTEIILHDSPFSGGVRVALHT